MKKAIFESMIEALRRDLMFNTEGTTLNQLGYPSEHKEAVKAGFLVPYHGEKARIISWYTLTEKGWYVINTWKSLGITLDNFKNYDFKEDTKFNRKTLISAITQ